jgi:hypothetical protein
MKNRSSRLKKDTATHAIAVKLALTGVPMRHRFELFHFYKKDKKSSWTDGQTLDLTERVTCCHEVPDTHGVICPRRITQKMSILVSPTSKT